MQTTSALWKQILADPAHRREYKAEIAGTTYGEDAIISIKTSTKLFAGAPAVGGCVSGELDLALYPQGQIPSMAEIKVYCRLVDATQQSEWLPQGIYYIDTREPDAEGESLDIHGYDAMLEVLSPSAVICLGKPFPEMRGNVIPVKYETFRREVR